MLNFLRAPYARALFTSLTGLLLTVTFAACTSGSGTAAQTDSTVSDEETSQSQSERTESDGGEREGKELEKIELEDIDLAQWRDHAREKTKPSGDALAQQCVDLFPDEPLAYIAEFIGPKVLSVAVEKPDDDALFECIFKTDEQGFGTQTLKLSLSHDQSLCAKQGLEVDHHEVDRGSSIEFHTAKVCSEADTFFVLTLRAEEEQRGVKHLQSTNFAEQLLQAAVTTEPEYDAAARKFHEELAARN